MSIRLGVLKEGDGVEKRVALVPDSLVSASELSVEVVVERGAGESAFFSDSEYTARGGIIIDSREEIIKTSDIIVMLQRPLVEDVEYLRKGAIVVGNIYPERNQKILNLMAGSDVTTFSLELIPRITRAQSMDVLSSQASAAGYSAAVLAAANSPKLMPMLTTAAGTIRPSRVLVIGAGIAGLMAIATSKRLGGTVSAFDVRKTAGEDVRSLGARFLETSFDAVGKGGYARELTESERGEQKRMLEEAVSDSDVIITAAGVPGRTAPTIVSGEMVKMMKRGAVIVDLAADSGGNCEYTEPGKTVMRNGVRIIGPVSAPSGVPFSSSQMYSRNMMAFLNLLVEDGRIKIDFSDEILKTSLVTHGGKVLYDGEKPLGS